MEDNWEVDCKIKKHIILRYFNTYKSIEIDVFAHVGNITIASVKEQPSVDDYANAACWVTLGLIFVGVCAFIALLGTIHAFIFW